MKKKILLMWTDPFSNNRGVGALTYSMLYLLEKISQETESIFEYYILGTSKIYGKSFVSILDKEIEINTLKFINPFGFKGIIKSIIYWTDFKKQLNIDYVLDIGEGDSFSDIYGSYRFREINASKKLFTLFRKKQMLLPQTIGPFINLKNKKAACNTINKIKTVTVRDRKSFDFVHQNCKNINLLELIDVAFFLPYNVQKFEKKRIHVGINISSLIWHGGYTKDNQFNLIAEYKNIIDEILSYFFNIDNVVIHLIPHVVNTFSDIENDYRICRVIEEKMASFKIVATPFFLDPIEAKSYISGLDFFTGARMHACIAAYSSSVPVYPLAYSPKFIGLFQDTLGYNYLGDLSKSSNHDIVLGLKNAFENRKNIKIQIEESINSKVLERKSLLENSLKKFLDL